jgi:hypothetical protein
MQKAAGHPGLLEIGEERVELDSRRPPGEPGVSTADLRAFGLPTWGAWWGPEGNDSARSSGPPGPDLTRAPRGPFIGAPRIQSRHGL